LSRLCITLSYSFTTPPPPPLHTPSLHDALPIYRTQLTRAQQAYDLAILRVVPHGRAQDAPLVPEHPAQVERDVGTGRGPARHERSEEHTSELQSHLNLVCRLLLEKKKSTTDTTI